MINLFPQKKSYTVRAGNEGVNVNVTKIIVGIGVTAVMLSLNPKHATGYSHEKTGTTHSVRSTKATFIAENINNGLNPDGLFSDHEWEILLLETDGGWVYDIRNKLSREKVEFGYPVFDVSNPNRHRYIWQDDYYVHEIAWRPADPNYIRIILRDSYGNIVLNRLLKKEKTILSTE